MNSKKHQKPAAEIPGVAAGILGVAAEIPGSHFFVSSGDMFGIPLKSRVFSSSTLMDGEDLVSSQKLDDLDGWSEDQLEAELQRLEKIQDRI